MKGTHYHLLDGATWSHYGTYDEEFTYDRKGNIQTTTRWGDDNGVQVIDEFRYHYFNNNNQLEQVVDNSGNSNFGMDGTRFGYDLAGNVTEDTYLGMTMEWRHDNKLHATSSDYNTDYLYDGMGNLVRKRIQGGFQGSKPPVDKVIHYVRDASGNVLAVYEDDYINPLNFRIKERYVYGTDMVAVLRGPNLDQLGMEIPDFEFMLKDHLGNVRAVVGENHSTPGRPDIKSYTNLYAFGAPHPKRNLNQLDQRFSFNGQEQPDEIKGPGLHYTAKYWEYDPVYGRRWNLDPRPQISISDYAVNGLNPITNIDPLGDWFWERSNVRQARTYAKKTGGEFRKWKGQNKKTYASVDIAKFHKDGAREIVFAPGEDRSDVLQNVGVGFYETQRATHSGSGYLKWLIRGLDAWSAGRSGEYDRNQQAPGIVKGVSGINSLVSASNAIVVLSTDKDMYNSDANTATDKVLAVAALVFSPLNPVKFNTPALLDRTNDGTQILNDTGLLDELKKEKSQDTANENN